MVRHSNGCYYLIGDCIEFRPEDNSLYSRSTGETITLFVAASRCLLLLLNQQGKVVSQKELFEAGWQKNGIGVSNNTFYQNILMLRKGLKHAGYEETVIKTVPRQGLTVPSTVPVEKIMAGTEKEYRKEVPVIVEDNPAAVSPVKEEKEEKKTQSQKWWLWGLAPFLCVVAVICVVWNVMENNSFFNSYTYAGKIEGCTVYLKNDRTPLKYYMQFIAKNNFTCGKQEFVYFATYPLVPRASAIRCKQQFSSGSKNNCISEYFLEWRNDE